MQEQNNKLDMTAEEMGKGAEKARGPKKDKWLTCTSLARDPQRGPPVP